MNYNIVKKSAGIIGGSAMSSIGFALGRDIYSKKKDIKNAIIGAMIVFAFVFIVYTAGLWLTRNYKKRLQSYFFRILAFIIIVSIFLSIYILFDQTDVNPLIALILPSVWLICGLIVGWRQRKTRTEIWEVEAANIVFMQKEGLIENSLHQIKDHHTGQLFRIESISTALITLFPIGRRGKRAYIKLGKHGRYTEYTGMIHV